MALGIWISLWLESLGAGLHVQLRRSQLSRDDDDLPGITAMQGAAKIDVPLCPRPAGFAEPPHPHSDEFVTNSDHIDPAKDNVDELVNAHLPPLKSFLGNPVSTIGADIWRKSPGRFGFAELARGIENRLPA